MTGCPVGTNGETPSPSLAQSKRRRFRAVYLCGGDETPGPRGTDCPNRLHDYPLPSGYVDAAAVAQRRLNRRWANRKCPDCGLYGWAPGVRDA